MGLLGSAIGHSETGAGNAALTPGYLLCILIGRPSSHPPLLALQGQPRVSQPHHPPLGFSEKGDWFRLRLAAEPQGLLICAFLTLTKAG